MKQQRQRKHQQQMSNTMDSFNHIINHNSNHNLPHINDHHYYRKSNIMTNHDTKLHRLNYHHSNDRLKRKIDLNFMNFSKLLSLSSSSSSSLSSLIILVISYLLLNGIFIVNANNNINNNQIIKTNEMNYNNYNNNNNNYHRTMINESMIMSNITLSTRLLLADSLLMDLNLSDAIEKLTNIWLLIHNHDHQNNNQQMNNDINDRLLQELSMISKLKSIKKEPKFNDFSEKFIFNQTNVNGEDDMMLSDDPSAYNDDSRNSTMTKNNEFIASTSDINESKQMNHQQQQQQQRQRIMKKFITNYANCSACTKNDEQTKKLRIESIKMKILNKLNMKHAPNVSLEMLPKIPPINSMLNRLSRMMNDQSVLADNDDQHPIGSSSSSSSSIRLMSKILDPNDHYGPTTNDYYDNNNSNENDNQSILNNDNNDSTENDNENDYDELMSAEKSIVFAQQKTPIDRVINQDLRSQFFKFPSNINQHHVKKAFLWVYLKGSSLSSSSPSSSILSSSQTSTATQSKINSWIVIYQIVRGTSTQLSLIKSKRISYNTTRKGGWIHLRVEKLVSKWFENPDTNLGIVIHAFDSNGQQLSVIHSDDVAQDSPLRPFIEISVDRRNSLQKRRKRTIGLNCEDKSAEVRCCRYPLTVDFEQFGWDWIIAPKRYQANYCSGECPFVLMNQYPHTHLIQQINMNAIGPCCSPRKMSSISMLYLDSDYNVIYGILPNMVVERCGCS